MPNLVLAFKKPFPHKAGLGASTVMRGPGRQHTPQPLSTTGATYSGSGNPNGSISTSHGRGGRSRNRSPWQGNSSSGGYASGPGSSGSGASQSAVNAFNTALSNASAAGLVSETQVAAFQAAANDATTQQLWSMTNQLNQALSTNTAISGSPNLNSAVPQNGYANGPTMNNWGGGWQGQGGQQNSWGQQGGWQGYQNQNQLNDQSQLASVSSSSSGPTTADLAALSTALNTAVNGGYLTSTQAQSYLSEAEGGSMTDAQVQQLTASINSALATASTSGAATSASWWDGSTTLFGQTVANSTLAIGGVIGVGLLYLFTRKR